jgi:diadenosine tetraphosphate (Ap4A) HIT family hydrolase
VSEGHSLGIPKRPVEALFDLPEAELLQVWSVLATVRHLLKRKSHPDGFNIGVNEGQAAGQATSHAHM